MWSKAIFMALLVLAFGAQARPVLTSEAARAARSWIASGEVLGARLGASVDPAKVRTVVVDRGVSFHLVPIEGGGTVVTSSDTEFEPIVLFTDKSVGELDRKGPLYRLLAKDAYARARLAQIRAQLTARVAAAQPGTVATALSTAAANLSTAAARANRQWDILTAAAVSTAAAPVTNDPPNRVISDLRVPALVKTKWDQSDVDGEPFYNYWIDALISSNKLCGCTATAMSQLIRYFEYPETGASKEYDCVVDGKTATFKTRGGAYDYANMPYVPSADDPDFAAQQSAVGSLAYDCAVALKSTFGEGLTSAYAKDTAKVLREQFGYGSAFVFADQGVIRGTSVGLHNEALREKTIYANLDAGKPVQLGIYGYVKSIVGDETVLDESNVEGHAVLADGYGFTKVENGSRTAYVHINLGWSGTDDAWYNIPEIDTATVGAMQGWSTGVDFLYLGEATFNVVSNDVNEIGKEIVAGRVLNRDGTPAENAEVLVLTMQSEVVARTTSNSNGIYVAYVPGGERQPVNYEVWARSVSGDLIAASEMLYVRQTSGDKDGVITLSEKVGNLWGIDLTLTLPAARLDGDAGRIYPTLDKAFAAVNRDGARLVEILRPIELKDNLVITNDNLTICATNADPRASEIRRLDGAKITVKSGAAVTFSNVAFRTEMSTPVEVLKGGLVKVAGLAVFDDIVSGVPGIVTANNTGFKLVGELLNGLTLQCESVTESDTRCGSYFNLSQEAADRSALRVVSPEGCDRACVADTGDLRWADGQEVVADTAVAYVAGAEGPILYRTLDRLFEEHPAGTNVVVTRSNARLGNPCKFTTACSIFPADILGTASIRVADMDKSPAFTLGAGAKLTVGNLVFEDYEGAGLFSINGTGAALTATNVTFRSVHGNNSRASAIDLKKGVARVTGSTFANCLTDGRSNSYGGAIYVGQDCRLDLEGSIITGCRANTMGGGIYGATNSTTRVSGSLYVRGNTSGNRGTSVDDIYLHDSTAQLELCGKADGIESVGVTCGVAPGDGFGNAEGDRFAVIACDASDATNSVVAFFNDVNRGLVAQVSDDGAYLVWAQPTVDDHQLDRTAMTEEEFKARAVVRVVKGTEVAYYEDVGYAFGWIDAPATVLLLKDAVLTNAVEVSQTVVFRSGKFDPADPDQTNVLTRAANVQVSVLKDAKLTLGRVVLDGGNGTLGLVDVSGGELVLDGGATVRNVSGSENRASGAVTVGNGTFVMNDGAAIVTCSNSHTNEGSKAGYGGGLLADHSTVRLNGGRIEGCSAYSAGGAFVGNGSTVYISGDVVIAGNTSRKGDDNLCVSDDSQLVLVDTPFSGAIGYMPGASADPNVFGRVDGSFEGTVSNALDSAHCFTNDVTRDVGMVATNADETLLVWGAAFTTNGTFVARDGKTYGLVKGTLVPIAVPEAVPGLRYTGNVLTGVVEGVGYVLEGNTGILTNTYHATATLRPGFVWDDGTTVPQTVEWQIDRGFYVLPETVKLESAEFPYDGREHRLEITGELPDWLDVTYQGNVMTLPGTNDVTATIFGESDNYEYFETLLTNKLVITGTYDPQQPDPGPVPPIDGPQWEVQTNHPTPIAFKSITRGESDTEWKLEVTNRVRYCNYRLLWTTDLTKGFVSTGDWEHVVHEDCAVWTTNVITTGGAWFWRAEGADGTNMVLKTVGE